MPENLYVEIKLNIWQFMSTSRGDCEIEIHRGGESPAVHIFISAREVHFTNQDGLDVEKWCGSYDQFFNRNNEK